MRDARKAIGDDMLLMVDYNGNYTVDVALESMRQIAPFNIHWCEEPLPPHDVAGYAELRARAPIRLSAGEAHSGVQDFKRMIDARAHRHRAAAADRRRRLRRDEGGCAARRDEQPARCRCRAGAAPSRSTPRIHFAASLPTWPHTDNLPYPMLVEYDVGDNPLRDQLVRNPIKPHQGALPIPQGPGLGLELNPEVVARYTIK